MLDRCVGLSIYNKTVLILGPLCNEDCRATTFVACRNHLNASCALAALTLRHSVENRFPATTTIEGKCCRYIPALRRHCYETIMVRRPMDKPAKQSNRISCTPRHNRARTTPPQPQPRHNNHNHGTTTTSTPQQPQPRHNNHNHATTTRTSNERKHKNRVSPNYNFLEKLLGAGGSRLRWLELRGWLSWEEAKSLRSLATWRLGPGLCLRPKGGRSVFLSSLR